MAKIYPFQRPQGTKEEPYVGKLDYSSTSIFQRVWSKSLPNENLFAFCKRTKIPYSTLIAVRGGAKPKALTVPKWRESCQ